MKIVQINGTYESGSTGKIIQMLASEIRKSGDQCLVCYANGKTKEKYSYKIGGEIDHKLHALLSRLTGLQGYFSKISTFLLVQNLIKYEPECSTFT